MKKSILLDADAVISILAYSAADLLEYFKENEINLHIIHPAFIELLRTDNIADRIKRQSFLSKYNVKTLPMISDQYGYASDIQTWLVEHRFFKASLVDLYLAATLKRYNKSGLYLLTANISDFPSPLFIRSAHVLMQNINSSKILYFLKISEDIFQESETKSETDDDVPF